jgi:protocatechuate 3,4-dioxygenase beta subunit
MERRVEPADITEAVIASFEGCRDPRLAEVMTVLVRHLHAFAEEVNLTLDEWEKAIAALTATGHITDERRQEFILWSDALGVSMLVDALVHAFPEGATESTVLGPFYVPGAPLRAHGESIAEDPGAGIPVKVYGRVLAPDHSPIAGAELDVWQNGEDMLYAVQSPAASENHLRGRFRTDEQGRYAFVGVRPVPYPIPDDGPVGAMLRATGRHPWRPAHIHMIVRARGYRTLTTHIFDAASEYLDSDAVFAVKPSLLRDFVRHDALSPDTPAGVHGEWYSVENDLVLAPGEAGDRVDPGRTA